MSDDSERITTAAPSPEAASPPAQGASLTWDEYFYGIAEAVLRKSKDKDRQVGAVVVGDGNVILTTGFNGFARGVQETPQRVEAEKLLWITHAETNAIFNAARKGISLVGSTLYVTTFPCAGCAQAIAQSGIKRVFTRGGYWIKSENENRYDIAPDIFADAHILVDAPELRKGEVGFWVQKDKDRRTEKARFEAQEAKAELAVQKQHAELLRLADIGRRTEQGTRADSPRKPERSAVKPLVKTRFVAQGPRAQTVPRKSRKR